jgi:hypothetical protein
MVPLVLAVILTELYSKAALYHSFYDRFSKESAPESAASKPEANKPSA